MANVECDFTGLEDLMDKFEKMNQPQAKDQLIQTGLKQLAAIYLTEAIKNTPTGERQEQEQEISEKAYGKVQGLEVKAKDFRRGSGASRTLKRKVKPKEGSVKYKILGTSEHMKRSWNADKIEKDGQYYYRIKVYNSASYADYVNDGHAQTPGRYVPMLGKRLVDNWVEGLHMAEKAATKTKKQQKRILSDLLNAYLARGFNGK